MNDRFKGMIFI